MFNNDDEQMYDEFGNPIYRSEMGPIEAPENYDALKLFSSINNKQTSLPLLQSIGNASIPSTEKETQTPVKSDLENKLSLYKQSISAAGGPSQAKAALASQDLNSNNKVIDFGSDKSVASLDKLKELQNQIKSNLNTNDLASGFNMIASAFSPEVASRVDKLLAQKRSEVDKPLKDYEQQILMEKKDPNSPFSKGFKDYVKKAFGYEIKGDIAASDLESTFLKPMLTQYEGEERRKSQEYMSEQNRLSREALAKESALNRSQQRDLEMMRFKESEGRKADQYQENKIQKYTQAALSSPEFKKAQETIGAIDRIKELAKDARNSGGQSLAMLGPQIAKGIAGEVGVLTEQDVTRYINDPSVAGNLRDKLLKAKSGKLSDVSYDNLMRLTEIMDKKSKDMRNKVYSDYATRLSRNSKDFSFEDAYKKINPEYLEGESVPSQTAQTEEKVKVSLPNGRIVSVLKKNLQEAVRRGAKEIK